MWLLLSRKQTKTTRLRKLPAFMRLEAEWAHIEKQVEMRM